MSMTSWLFDSERRKRVIPKTSFSNFISHLFSRVQFVEEEEEDDEENQESGLLVELEEKDEKKERETSLWFSKVCQLHCSVLCDAWSAGCSFT